MKVTTFMTQTVVSVEMDDTLQIIKDLFEKTGFHHLVVVEGKRLVGVISDRDLLRALSPNIGTAAETAKDLACLNKKAHQIMTRNPISLTTEAQLADVVGVFNQHPVSCVPIVDQENNIKGIVSWRDIMRVLGEAYARQQ